MIHVVVSRATRVLTRAGSVVCLMTAGAAVHSAAEISSGRDAARVDVTFRMQQRVDQLLAREWHEAGITATHLATDAEFLRRAYLDITGCIPRVSEVRAFLSEERATRRKHLIDSLLERPAHATHLANTWKRFLLPDGTDLERFGGVAGFEHWLRERFAHNVPYDRLVTELLLAKGTSDQSGPALFYTALQLKPEKLAASTSRALLGVQLQCAQCHDHPLDKWSQRDFWGYAAFFARVKPASDSPGSPGPIRDAPTGEVRLPGTDQIVLPQYLGGGAAPSDAAVNRRELLAQWIVAADNPFFARTAVNRVWAHLFGHGLVDPPDDMGDHNPPSHPQLLHELVDYFCQSGYDLRQLIRMLAGTQAYQRSSEVAEGVSAPSSQFARMAIKSLTAEQLYDSLAVATCRRQPAQLGGQTFGLNRVLDPNRQAFLSKFRSPSNHPTIYRAGIPQALSVMNGRLTTEATDVETSDILVSLQAPFFTDQERVEVLFLASLSRPPSAAQRRQFVDYVAAAESREDKRRALGDILWALLNSAEFMLNH